MMKELLEKHARAFEECYRITDIAEFITEGRQFRIEVRESILTSEPIFDVTAYEMNRDGNWGEWTDFPWISRGSAQGAMAQAIGFLKERTELRAA